MKRLLLTFFAVQAAVYAEEGWWMREPIRWVQTNLRQTDANLDANHLIAQLSSMQANVLLFGMGGLAAYYPTKVPFHYRSPDLKPGRDLFGDVLTLAHEHHIRVVGRFDFSKTSEEAYRAHPEWFFRKADGSPVVYNGFYSTCINGGYYRKQAMEILAEALTGYKVDGLFFNMFGNQSRDYSGKYVGLCHCDVCQTKYRQLYGKAIPDQPDEDYRKFMFTSSREVAAAIGELIRSKRPEAGYFNYIQESTDGIMSESNTALSRPLPMWPYSASDNVNRAQNSEPGKIAINLCMQFVDYWWRFATVPQPEIATRLWENVANGGALAFEVNGTLDQQDRQAVDTATPIFRWLAKNEQFYSGQKNAARVLLLGGSEKTGHTYSQERYRGLFRLLTEEHLPFAVSDNAAALESGSYDLVVASDWAPKELESYIRNGGHALIVSPRHPEFPIAPVVKDWPEVKGYFRIRDHKFFPSMTETDLMMVDGPYAELEGQGTPPLTLVPPSMFAPPELVHVDLKDTDQPGVVFKTMGKGTVAWVPWDLGGLYYRLSLPAHEELFRDLMDRLQPIRQLRTNAHPLIEMTWMKQGNRHLLHLINHSGHSDTGYFAPVPIENINVDVAGEFKTATSIRNPAKLTVRAQGGRSALTIPKVSDYELIVLQ